jgi:RHS repeat-associated protein
MEIFTLVFSIENNSRRATYLRSKKHWQRVQQGDCHCDAGRSCALPLRERQRSTGAVTWRSYVYLAGKLVDVVKTSASVTHTYVQTDYQGSTIALTDKTGAIDEQDAYDVYGVRRVLTSVTGTAINRTYTNQEYLSDVALFHYNARIYDPQIGKFLSGDPLDGGIDGAQSWNRYAYVQGNPLNRTDPTGMDYIDISGDGTEVDSGLQLIEIPVFGHIGPWGAQASADQILANLYAVGIICPAGAQCGTDDDGSTPGYDIPTLTIYGKRKSQSQNANSLIYLTNYYALFTGYADPNLLFAILLQSGQQKSRACQIANALSAYAEMDSNIAFAAATGAAVAGKAPGALASKANSGLGVVSKVFGTSAFVESLGAGIINGYESDDYSDAIVTSVAQFFANASELEGYTGDVASKITDQLQKAAGFPNACQ